MYQKLWMKTTIVLLGLVAGCIPYSENPLSFPQDQPLDASLYGTWFWEEDKETGYLHFGKDETSKLIRVIMVNFNRELNIEVSEFTGHSSTVGPKKYLNLKWVRPMSNSSGYMFIKYEVKGDSLGVALPSKDVVEKAIENGLLEGSVDKAKMVSTVRITAKPDKLRKFVLENDRKLYKEIVYIDKVRLHKQSMHKPQ
jgi:hypothetical protein